MLDRLRALGVFFVAASLLAGGSVAMAQDDGAQASRGAIDEVTVTSQKKEQSIQSVPVSVSAVTGDRLQSMGAMTIEALRGYIPNVQIQQFSNTPHGSVFSIRGMGVIEPDPYGGTTVVVVQDEVPQFFNMISLLDIYDIDRIEVLRGPQGTLFGANSTGGVIQAITKRPDLDEFGGNVKVGYGNYSRVDIQGALNIPIIEGVFAARLAFTHMERDGYLTNVSNGRSAGDKDRSAARLSLLWDGGGDLDVTLIGEYSIHDDGAPASVNGAVPLTVGVDGLGQPTPAVGAWANAALGCQQGAPCLPGQLWGEGLFVPEGHQLVDQALPAYASPCLPAGTRCKAPDKYFTGIGPDTPDLSDMDVYALTLQVNWDSPIGEISSVTAYKDFRLHEFSDQDYTHLHGDSTERRTEGWQFSQEIRDTFSPFEGMETMIGVLLAQYNWNHFQDFRIQFSLPGLRQLTQNVWQTEVASVFMHSFYEVTERFRLQGGVRFNYEKTKADVQIPFFLDLNGEAQYQGHIANRTPGPNEIFLFEVNANDQESWSELAGKFGAEFDLSEDALLYGYYAHGFKSGGFTGRIGVPQDLGPYNPETVDTIEFGAKTDWFDNRLRFNVAFFYNWYKDIQLAEIFFELVNGVQINRNTILNGAGAATKGIEVEIIAVPVDWLTLNAALGYLDAKFTEFDTFSPVAGAVVDNKGNQLQNAPEWTANLGFVANFMVGNALELTINGQYKYVSKKFNTSLFNTPRSEIQPTHIVDLNVDIGPPDGQWTLGIWARNLFDERYIDSVFDAPGVFALVNYQDPRTYGVNVKANF